MINYHTYNSYGLLSFIGEVGGLLGLTFTVFLEAQNCFEKGAETSSVDFYA